MTRTNRARWNALSPVWQAMLREASGFEGTPGPRDLAALFAALAVMGLLLSRLR